MARMHATEGRGHSYDYALLSGLDLALEGGGVLDEAFAYIHRGGALKVNGGLVGLSEIAAAVGPVLPGRSREPSPKCIAG